MTLSHTMWSIPKGSDVRSGDIVSSHDGSAKDRSSLSGGGRPTMSDIRIVGPSKSFDKISNESRKAFARTLAALDRHKNKANDE